MHIQVNGMACRVCDQTNLRHTVLFILSRHLHAETFLDHQGTQMPEPLCLE